VNKPGALWATLWVLLMLVGIPAASCDELPPMPPTSTPTVAPTATATATQTMRPTATVTITVTPTPIPSPIWCPTATPPPPKACWDYERLSYVERQRVWNAALYHLGRGIELDLLPYEDVTLVRGMIDEALGAPQTISYAVESDVRGELLRCRGFALGILVMRESAERVDCRNWTVLGWDGEEAK